MGKVCISCGDAPVEAKKPENEPEDCVNCGEKEGVKTEEKKEE